MREQLSLSSLNAVLENKTESDDWTWSQIVERECTKADKVREVADVFVAARFKLSCNEVGTFAAVKLLQACETAARCLAQDTTALSLIGGSVEALRQKQDALRSTLTFADSVASLDLFQAFIQHFFDKPENIVSVRASADELLRKSSAITESATLVNSVAQLDPELWSGAESFDLVPLQNLFERNKCALEHLAALRDYLSFLLAEDAAIDQGIGPVLSVYSDGDEDYRNLAKAVEFVFYRSAAEAILNNDPRLRRHSGATHQELRNQFRILDREYLELKRKELALKLTQRAIPAGNSFGPVAQLTEVALVTRVAGQTRPRIMVRD